MSRKSSARSHPGGGVPRRRPSFHTTVSVLALALGLTACASGAGPKSAQTDVKSATLLKIADETAATDPATASSLYRQLHDMTPKDPVPLGRLGATFLTLEDYRSAAIAYRAAIALDPDNGDFHRGLALADLVLGDPQSAMTEVRAALAKHAEDARLYSVLGVAQDMMGQHDVAQQSYQHGLEMSPANIGLRNNYAMSLALAGDYGTAVSKLAEIAGPDAAPRYRLNLALAYGLSGDDAKAATIARQVLDEPAVQNNLAFYALLRGMTEQQRNAAIIGSELHGGGLPPVAVAKKPAPPDAVAAAPQVPVTQTALNEATIIDEPALPPAPPLAGMNARGKVAKAAPNPESAAGGPVALVPPPAPLEALLASPPQPAPAPVPVASAPPPPAVPQAPAPVASVSTPPAPPPQSPAPPAAPPSVANATPAPAPPRDAMPVASVSPPPAAPAPVTAAPPAAVPVASVSSPQPAPSVAAPLPVDLKPQSSLIPLRIAAPVVADLNSVVLDLATAEPVAMPAAAPADEAPAIEPASPPPQTAAAAPVAEPPSLPPQSAPAAAQPAPAAPADEPAVPAAPPATAMPEAIMPRADRATADRFTVQLGSYMYEASARHDVALFTAKGVAVTLSRAADRDGREWFVIRTPAVDSHDEADTVRQQLRSLGAVDPLVLHQHASDPAA